VGSREDAEEKRLFSGKGGEVTVMSVARVMVIFFFKRDKKNGLRCFFGCGNFSGLSFVIRVGKGKGLNQISDIKRHLINLCVVELFDFTKHPNVVSGDKIDRHTLSSEPPTTADTVNVVLAIRWKIVVDDE